MSNSIRTVQELMLVALAPPTKLQHHRQLMVDLVATSPPGTLKLPPMRRKLRVLALAPTHQLTPILMPWGGAKFNPRQDPFHVKRPI